MSRVYAITVRCSCGVEKLVHGHGNTRSSARRSAIASFRREHPHAGYVMSISRVEFVPEQLRKEVR